MKFLTTREALFSYSEWLDSEGLIISDSAGDKRTHEELVRDFLKPDEPTGLGAVVEDDEGNPWVKTLPGIDDAASEWIAGFAGNPRLVSYSSIRAVRVLSPGVEE